MQYIAKIDKAKFKMINENIISDIVILTNRQVEHIKERHPNDYERYFIYFKEIIENPDYIIKDTRPNTGLLLKEIKEEEKYFELILRLHTEKDNPKYRNSIITFFKINKRKYQQYLRNKEIVWKNLDKSQ